MTMMDPPASGVEPGKVQYRTVGDQTGKKIHGGQMNLDFDRISLVEALNSCLDECDSPFDFGTSYDMYHSARVQ